MKNKKMILVVAIIVILGLGSIFIPKFFKQQNKVKSADVKIGVLQFVTHPALDEIYSGIKEGLADEGYSDAKI
ncbi:MAG: ABC transporter substrate binding protein, partial [Pseudolactococcus laudensis]